MAYSDKFITRLPKMGDDDSEKVVEKIKRLTNEGRKNVLSGLLRDITNTSVTTSALIDSGSYNLNITSNTVTAAVDVSSMDIIGTFDDGIIWSDGVDIYFSGASQQHIISKEYTDIHNLSLPMSSPVQVGSLTNWSKVFCGRQHTLAINTVGQLYSWGFNSWGQLGLNDQVDRSSPVQVGSLTNWSQVACGYGHTLAINTSGQLYSWGGNGDGQLGLNNTTQISSPVQVGSLSNWSQVACGYMHTLAINTSGQLYSWGANTDGQLGLNDDVSRSSPVQVGSLTNWSQVATGSNHTLAINAGRLYACGFNGNGQLGLDDTLNRSSPVQVGSLTNWSQVATGTYHTLAINTSGQLYSWGENWAGQLGLNDNVSRSSPVQVGSLTNWSQVSVGRNHFTLTINTSGQLYACGYNDNGQLGLNDDVSRSSPVQVGSLTNWSQVACGSYHTLAINTSGQLYAFGKNGYITQLGLCVRGKQRYKLGF